MKKLFTHSIFTLTLMLSAVAVKAQTTTWDFTASNPSWVSGSIGGTDPVVDYVDPKGLGLHGIATNTNFGAWQANQSPSSWSAPNDVYTAATVRVQTGGGGYSTTTGVEATPTQRYFFIEVNQACVVKVWFKSGSGGAIRSVIASDGTTVYGKAASVGNVAPVAGFPNDGGFLSVNITKAGTFFLYGDAAVNIYQIQVIGATVDLTPVNTLTTIPVRFTNISASIANGTVKVIWNNESEINTQSYQIERSSNGINYTTVGTVSATNARQYNWFDYSPAAGNSFYRIKAIDVDGKLTFSSIVKLNITNKLQEIAINPNPVKNGLVNLQLTNMEKGNYTFTMFNRAGQNVFTKTIGHTGGNSSEALVLPSTIVKGIYDVQIKGAVRTFTKTVLVQ